MGQLDIGLRRAARKDVHLRHYRVVACAADRMLTTLLKLIGLSTGRPRVLSVLHRCVGMRTSASDGTVVVARWAVEPSRIFARCGVEMLMVRSSCNVVGLRKWKSR